MNISYDYYRIFYYIVKCQSFSGAARALMNNQPNISRTMKRLEAELGCDLLIRQKKGVKLTPEGERLYQHISVAFEHILAGEQEISEDRSLESGTVTISTSEIALHCTLLPVLKEFHMAHPKVKIRVSNHTTPQAIDVLKNGLADLAIVTTPLGAVKSLYTTPLRHIQEVPVCSSFFSELSGKTLSLKEVSQFPIISLGENSNSYAFYSSLFSEAGIPFSPDIEASTADQILPLVRNNLGIGFVPVDFIEQKVHAKELLILQLDRPIPKRQICLLKRRDTNPSIAARELERQILQFSEW